MRECVHIRRPYAHGRKYISKMYVCMYVRTCTCVQPVHTGPMCSLVQTLWEGERDRLGLEKKQSFVDLGCGNGLLVHLLSSEGVSICTECLFFRSTSPEPYSVYIVRNRMSGLYIHGRMSVPTSIPVLPLPALFPLRTAVDS